ncbi:unnamed protein product, partial [Prorocentrum cordatum]
SLPASLPPSSSPDLPGGGARSQQVAHRHSLVASSARSVAAAGASRLRRDAPRQPSEGLPSPLPVSWRRPMAPKRGRPSTGFTANKKPAKAANKKPAKAVHVGGLCDVVAKSLDADTGLAESVVKLLRDSIPTSLALLKEERHAFQEQAVQMIGQALDAKGAALDRAREEAAAKLAEVAEAASATDAAVAEAEEEAKALADAEAAAAVKASEDAAAQKAARGAAAAATKAQADGEASLAGSEASKAALEAVQKEHFEPLVEGTAADAKASLKVFSKAAKEYLEVEEGTLDNISSTLGKAKGDRSTFDGLVVNLLAEAVAKALADLGAKIEAGSKAKEGFAAAVAATAEASAAAASALEASERALAEAKEAAKAGVGKVKAAKA